MRYSSCEAAKEQSLFLTSLRMFFLAPGEKIYRQLFFPVYHISSIKKFLNHFEKIFPIKLADAV
jgi:hypothetical protein